MPTPTTVAGRLKLLRGLGGVSLRELARLAGTSAGYPALIEAGERERLGGDVAASLARVLGCTMEFLVCGVGERPSKAVVIAAIERARAGTQREPGLKMVRP